MNKRGLLNFVVRTVLLVSCYMVSILLSGWVLGPNVLDRLYQIDLYADHHGDSPPEFVSVFTDPEEPTLAQDLCPGSIVLEVYAVVKDDRGLDWVRLYYDINGAPQPHLESDLDGQSVETVSFALGPFQQPGAVRYHLLAWDTSGASSSTTPATVTVADCPQCTSWSVSYASEQGIVRFAPAVNGFRFHNFPIGLGEGNCVGFSAAAMDYFEHRVSIPSAYNRWVTLGTDPHNDLSCYIKQRQLEVDDDANRYLIRRVLEDSNQHWRNREEYTSIRDRIRYEHKTALVGLGIGRGHAVLVYGAAECTDGRVALFAYDSNKVFEVGGAYPGVINGRFTVSPYFLEIEYPSSGGTTYGDLFADFLAGGDAVPKYPDLGGCDDESIDTATLEMTAAGYTIDSRSMVEITLSPGEQSPVYPFWNEGAEPFAVFASWPGGRLQLSVFRPDGSLYSSASSLDSPLIVTIPESQPIGAWSYRLAILGTAEGSATGGGSYNCISGIAYRRFDAYLPLVEVR